MRVGVPKEIKVEEYRVGLTPASVREYVAHGHEVLHIDDVGPAKPHKLTAETRMIDGRLLYRGDRLL